MTGAAADDAHVRPRLAAAPAGVLDLLRAVDTRGEDRVAALAEGSFDVDGEPGSGL